MAKNLVIGGNWLFMFTEKFVLPDGSVTYTPYNPFPVFPFLIIGHFIRPLEPNLAMQVMAAHQLMNLFLIGAMLLCFLLTRTLLHNSWQALTVTLLAYSSHYMLAYNDMIFNDVPALFGCMLMLFMVVKIESGSAWSRAWLWSPVVAISMGWQPYAVLAAWLVLDVLRHLWTRQALTTLLRRPAVIAFAAAVGWGVLVLTLQVVNEWRALGGEVRNILILQTALRRFGLQPQHWYSGNEAILSWPAFIDQQVRRATLMLVPFAYGLVIRVREIVLASILLFALGIFVFRRQLSLSSLALLILSYLCWAIPMKQFVTVHDFQSIFMVSVAIAFFTVLVLYLRPPVMPVVAVVTCALFILTVYRVNQVKNELAPMVNAVTAEFQAIYDQLPRESKLFVCGPRDVMGEHTTR